MKKLIITLLLPLLLCGCTVKTGNLTEPETVSPVYTDWSKLAAYETPKPEYKLHAGYSGAGTLSARSDYGTLVSYVGAYCAKENYIIDELPLFGLVTSKGELVTDPIYLSAVFNGDFLLLYRGISGEKTEPKKGKDDFSEGTMSLTLAAADGSWAYELKEAKNIGSGEDIIVTAARDGSLDVWNKDGEVKSHFDSSILEKLLGKDFDWAGDIGNYIDWTDAKIGYLMANYYKGKFHEKPLRLYLDFESGEVLRKPPKGYPAEIDYESQTDEENDIPVIDGKTNLGRIVDRITGEKYYREFIMLDIYDGSGYYNLYDSDGNMVAEKYRIRNHFMMIDVRAGLCSAEENGCLCLRRISDGETIFRYVIKNNYD